MPMSPPVLLPIFSSSLSPMTGVSIPLLSSALSIGLSLYCNQVIVNSIDVGTLGAGVGIGTIIAPLPILTSGLVSSFLSKSLSGTFSSSLATLIASGISNSFSNAIVQTTSPSVGVGYGKCLFISNPASSNSIFNSVFISSGFKGSSFGLLASAIASGIDTSLPSFIGNVVISGSASPYPSSGSGIGKII